ncbi:MAG: MFS transporter [Candidatus Cryptobacteroides sp.]
MKNESIYGRLTFTILSISLLTVMAGAAIAPALGIISDHFSGSPALLMQLIVSLPALTIILTNLVFDKLCARFKTRTLALTGLAMYVLTGCGCFLVDNIWLLLLMRALLGVSVGIIMPLSTGLLAFYFPPEKQAPLMGLSAAMNQAGGVVATFLAGILANIQWNYAFLVYAIGVFAIILVIAFLPNEKLASGGGISLKLLKRFHPSVVGMFLVMVLFFIYPTTFAISAHSGTTLSNNSITLIMAGLDVVAMLSGLCFGKLMRAARHQIKYMAPAGYILGYVCLSAGFSLPLLLAGTTLIGFSTGIGVPYLNTIAAMKAGKEAASTVMPLLSAALYLGQFISPVLVTPLSELCFGSGDILGPYKTGVILGLGFLLQAFLTRNKQVVE